MAIGIRRHFKIACLGKPSGARFAPFPAASFAPFFLRCFLLPLDLLCSGLFLSGCNLISFVYFGHMRRMLLQLDQKMNSKVEAISCRSARIPQGTPPFKRVAGALHSWPCLGGLSTISRYLQEGRRIRKVIDTRDGRRDSDR